MQAVFHHLRKIIEKCSTLTKFLKRERRLPENYRAIVMVSIIFDVVEKAIKLWLIKYLVNFGILAGNSVSDQIHW